MHVGGLKVPEVVVGFVEEIEAIETFDPSDFDVDIESGGVGFGVVASVVVKLIGADDVAVGYDRPVVCVAIDYRNFVGRKLKDFEDLVGLILCDQ